MEKKREVENKLALHGLLTDKARYTYRIIGGKKMTKKAKVIAIILAFISLIGITTYLVIGNPVVLINNQKLGSVLKSIEATTVNINEIVPFDWDTIYTFEPYTPKESIESIIGFKSNDIQANNINEGMVHLLFVKDKQVVASVLGYSQNLGYRLDFSSKVEFAENAVFKVETSDGIVELTYIKHTQ